MNFSRVPIGPNFSGEHKSCVTTDFLRAKTFFFEVFFEDFFSQRTPLIPKAFLGVFPVRTGGKTRSCSALGQQSEKFRVEFMATMQNGARENKVRIAPTTKITIRTESCGSGPLFIPGIWGTLPAKMGSKLCTDNGYNSDRAKWEKSRRMIDRSYL